MKTFRKYLLRFLVLLIGARKIYREKIIDGKLFSQKTKGNDLLQLIKHAKQKIPYYKNHLPEIDFKKKSIFKSFTKLNFKLEKSVLKEDIFQVMDPNVVENGNFIDYKHSLLKNLTKVFRNNLLIPLNTAGSSGNPLHFYKSKQSGIVFLLQFLECAKYHGWQEGDVFMVCMQEGVYSQLGFIKKILSVFGFPMFMFKKIDKQSSKQFIKLLNKSKPTIIFSFPSYLSELSIHLKNQQFKPSSKIKSILSTGEMLFDHQRKIMENIFNTKVYNLYGSNEMRLVAMECKKQNGLHIFENYVLLENDKKGHILGTTLGEFYMPLIKYNTGDRGIIKLEKCSCGIKGLKITNLEGRIEEYLISGKQKKVYASYLRQLLLEANEDFNNSILRAQFIQKKSGKLIFYIQLTDKSQEKVILQRLINRLKNNLHLKVSGKVVNKLFQKKGKFKFLIREK